MQKPQVKPKVSPQEKPKVKPLPRQDPDRRLNPDRLCPGQRETIIRTIRRVI